MSGKQDGEKDQEGYSIHNPGNPDFQRRMASAFGNLEQTNPGGGRAPPERDSRGPWQRPPVPDYVVNPNRWTRYSLQEEEDLNDQTNRAAALDFLADLRRRHNDEQPLNIFEDSDSKEEEEEEEEEEDGEEEKHGDKKKEEEKKEEKKGAAATKQYPPKPSSRPWDPEGRAGRHTLPPPPPMMLINPPLSVHSSLSKRPMQSVPLPKTSGSAALPKAEVRPSVGNTADTTYFRPTFQPRWNRAPDQGGKTEAGTAGAPPDNGSKPDSASRWMSGTYTMPEYRVGQKRKASRPMRQSSEGGGQKEQPAALGLQHLQWYDDEEDEDDDAVPTGVSWEASAERPSEETSSHTAKRAKKNIRPRQDD
ncbi:TSSC4 [Branchiostoma lanceolatum]|uniref:U5 small nuclear ribonucleoprotein TSSC4 n=1 Tax=Branchiostoma lanceolatum TaxID=7740 RepID=A0A8J9Z1L6_BRALA|nr:TSSC4 [Branchiostoma lanceolatum]